MSVRSLLVLVLAFACSPIIAKGVVRPDDLSGTWIPAAAELAGVKYPDDVRKTITLVVKDDKYTVTVGTLVDQGTMKLNADATPKEMDVTGTDGPNKGRTILAIYEHTGDTLRICYELSGSGRPKQFKTDPGSTLFLVTYERKKP